MYVIEVVYATNTSYVLVMLHEKNGSSFIPTDVTCKAAAYVRNVSSIRYDNIFIIHHRF